ncbi:MAG: sucrase ferredoxin [Chloroflexia bacterium]|nr:sucrase ferredoxin [Chloroflexia bacterium]
MTSVAAQQSKVQLCSVVSAASGEDPIGSAWHTKRYTMIELPLPWKYNTLESPNVTPGLGELVQSLYARQIYPGLVGFAPDDAWSVPGMTRVIDYTLPEPPFSAFEQREYLIPTSQVTGVLGDLLAGGSSTALDAFAVQPPVAQSDIFVCTHGAIDACCATYGYPIYKLLRHMADNPAHQLRAWRCTHFGGHRFAATLLDMPQGRYWGHLTAQDLGLIVRRDGDVELLRKRYRGWAALPYGGAQVAEGEAFRRAGWDWLDCLVTPGDAPPHDFDHGPTEEQRMSFAFQHTGHGIDGSVEFAITPNGTIRTKGSSKGDDWIDATQFVTNIVAEQDTRGFFDSTVRRDS